MAVSRPQAGRDMLYRGRVIVARHCRPDLLGYVDDVELNGFYKDTAAVWRAGVRYVDEKIKADEERVAKLKTGARMS